MQTFLPYPDFAASVRSLDQKRLGKQRVEAIQVVRALTVPDYAWRNHPAALMWRGHEEALGRYGFESCEAWLELGFGDTCATTIAADLAAAGITSVRSQDELASAGALPPWLGDPDLHRSDLPYVWPVRSPAVVEAERKRVESAARREERAAQRLLEEAERARRRRSRAARKGWRTRRESSG